MKNLGYKFAIGLVAILLFVACDTQILNEPPSNEVSDEAVWNDPALAEAFVNDIYLGMEKGLREDGMPRTGRGLVRLTSLTDDGMDTHGRGLNILQGVLSPSNIGSSALRPAWSNFAWSWVYSRIRQTNVFFDNIRGSVAESENPDLIERLKGEVHFLRAYLYHNLLRLYGGVPLIQKSYSLDDEDMQIPRNTFAETVDFIVADADTAAILLPVESDLGRATEGAALALKSRVLLYAASDLYSENPSGMAETGYTDGNQQDRWRAAKEAAQEVIDLGRYSLFGPNPADDEEATQNFINLFLQKDHSENIMSRHYLTERHASEHRANPNLYNGPNGYHEWSGSTPIQQLVDAFQKADGSEFDWSDSQDASAPYENRDPRFYASILYDGADWAERPNDMQSLDPEGVISTFSTFILPDGNTLPGIDTRSGPVETWNGSYTGYHMRKFLDPDFAGQQDVVSEVPYRFFRYAEILFNYAEASIELGEHADARRELNKIRRRAHMPEFDATLTGAELMDQYRNERRVELAFEGHRYFDIRRWMIAPDVMNENAKRIDITVEGTDRADRSTYHNYQYNVVDVEFQQRSWADKIYFYPIDEDEINRNEALVQNPGY